MGLFYFHAGTCKSADCSNNCTARRTAKKKTGLRAETLQNLSFYTQAHVTRNTHIYLL